MNKCASGLLLHGDIKGPLVTSVNCISRVAGCTEWPVSVKGGRLVLIILSAVVLEIPWLTRGPLRPGCFHTATHGGLNGPTGAYCRHSPKRKDSKLPCQEL